VGYIGGTIYSVPGALAETVGGFVKTHPVLTTRIVGVGRAIGGVFEIAGGVLTSEIGVGIPVVVKGVDDFQAGIRQLFTGEQTNSLIYDATKNLTGSSNLAGFVDFGTGVAASSAAARFTAQRAAAVAEAKGFAAEAAVLRQEARALVSAERTAAETRSLASAGSVKFSGDPYAFGTGSRLERVDAIISEAVKSAGAKDIYKLVDEIYYGTGSSRFEVDEYTGIRSLTIGSNAFNKTAAGQLIEANHEIAHAQVFDKLVKKLGYEAAYEESFVNRYHGSKGYAREEQLVERLARWRVRHYLGGLSPQQEAVSTLYIRGWRDVERYGY
jgi:hypothetical protein